MDSVAGGNTARYCESGGVLLYTVDTTLRNGLGVYKVLDALHQPAFLAADEPQGSPN